jgi:nucleotide-binding universal stress UspA family protein
VEIAQRFLSPLTLLTVLPPGGEHAGADLEVLVPADEAGLSIRHQLEQARDEALARSVPRVDIVFLRGSPADSILQYLSTHPPDLVVVGTRGLSRSSRLLRESVSNRLVNEASCHVLVVRRAPRKRA